MNPDRQPENLSLPLPPHEARKDEGYRDPPTLSLYQDAYAFLDCGHKRRLERFGSIQVDRPAPVATGSPRLSSDRWSLALLRFHLESPSSRKKGRWIGSESLPQPWHLSIGPVRLELRPTASGQLGFFPEHLAHTAWLEKMIHSLASAPAIPRPPRVLHLFAYTGLLTLMAAHQGAEVCHVDSAKTALTWARRNAELSGLQNAPIRWILEDAQTFVRREVAREKQYEGVILDPPTFGRGPRGEIWKLEAHLPQLLEAIRILLREEGFLLLTCHPTGWSIDRLNLVFHHTFPHRSYASGEMRLTSSEGGHSLPVGFFLRSPAA